MLPGQKPIFHHVVFFAMAMLVAIHFTAIFGSAQMKGGPVPTAIREAVNSVCGKRVVVLGELPSHGEAMAFQAKAEIVESLVTRCGFHALLFEAPIYDFVGFDAALARRTATSSQLDRAIGRFWLNRELADWRHWLFERAGRDGLILGGLDDQVSITSDYARTTLPQLVQASLPASTSVSCREAVERNLYWRYDSVRPFDEREKADLASCVRAAADRSLSSKSSQTSAEQTMLDNLASYADRQRNAGEAMDRDKVMYRNYLWYVNRMPKRTKVIIWTATVHAARRQGNLPQMPLGARLSERLSNQLAVIGFTAFAGYSSMAGRPPKRIEDAPEDSLESFSKDTPEDWRFLNSVTLRKMGNVSSRLWGPFTKADWSIYFDGILVAKKEIAPTFEPPE